MSNQETSLAKRRWCYVLKPRAFDVSPCDCGNPDIDWSEYEKHVWCAKCNKDFIPKHAGIFEGPIPVGAFSLLGLSFDRINLDTQKIEKFDTEKLTYEKSNG